MAMAEIGETREISEEAGDQILEAAVEEALGAIFGDEETSEEGVILEDEGTFEEGVILGFVEVWGGAEEERVEYLAYWIWMDSLAMANRQMGLEMDSVTLWIPHSEVEGEEGDSEDVRRILGFVEA